MKRAMVVICTFVVVISMLTGCVNIDEMRARHGFWTDDGNIAYCDNEYYKLPECKYINLRSYDNIFVTDIDVPVLVSEMFGTRANVGYQGLIIEMLNGSCFCRSDKYESVKNRILNGIEFDHLCYVLDGYDPEKEDVFFTDVLLSDDQYFAVMDTLSNGEVCEIGGYYYESIALYYCSEDMIFSEYAFDLVNLVNVEEKYYIAVYEKGSDVAIYYAVSKQNEQIISDIFDDFYA